MINTPNPTLLEKVITAIYIWIKVLNNSEYDKLTNKIKKLLLGTNITILTSCMNKTVKVL
jgi:uncharacterized ion transporter superfamily protein YfcC